jgi:hypothetical protein
MSLLSVASSEKSITCSFSNSEWFYLNRTFRTCNVENQAINSVGYTIISSVDSTLEGFSLKNNPEVQFLPDNLSQKFPNLTAVNVFNCSIKSVDEHHFKGLHDLITLDKLGEHQHEQQQNPIPRP